MDYRALLATGVPDHGPGSLPLTDLPAPQKKVVFDALREAWCRLVKAGTLHHLDEDAITARLKEVLNHMLVEQPSPVPGFSELTFETVVRDANVAAHDGSSLDKRPDLVFRPHTRHPAAPYKEYRGLFTECKLVGPNHRIGLYGAKGIRRFIDGEYAWAMPVGLMVAYDRYGTGVTPRLRECLARASKKPAGDPYNTSQLPTKAPRYGSPPPVYMTRHQRTWTYASGGAPGELRLFHLWLSE